MTACITSTTTAHKALSCSSLASSSTSFSTDEPQQNDPAATTAEEDCHNGSLLQLSAQSPPRSQQQQRVWIGGPDTKLPVWFESLLAWILALSCLSVSCWYYACDRLCVCWRRRLYSPQLQHQQHKQQNPMNPMPPLMTHSRQEQDTVATYVGIWHRLQELRHLLDTTKKPLKEWSSSLSSSSSLQQQQELVSIFHTNETARRLVSLIMTIQPIGVVEQAIHLYGSANNDGDTMQTFIHELISLWPRIMDFPPVPAGLSFEFELSVIVPAYREDGRELAYKLDSLIQNASSPIDIEIIVLDAGFCTHMDALQEQLRQQNCTEQQHPSCQITFYQYVNGGGRGPCLNYGAKLAKGRILTFLHADTRLVSTQDESWDMAIRNTFVMEDNTPTPSVTTTCCAFSFAIDQSPRALLGFGNRRASQDNHRIRSGTSSSSLYYHPPGLRAVQVTANFRSRFFQLPYGDQCLSMPSHIYHFIGGFPNQCLMEDYELVKLLRQRSMMIHSTRIFKQPFLSRGDEQLKILNLKAYCSPRRWQSYGVLYVTYTNSRLVRLYNKKNNDRKPSSSRNQTNDRLSPDDLFCQYYGTAHQKYKDRMGGKPKGE